MEEYYSKALVLIFSIMILVFGLSLFRIGNGKLNHPTVSNVFYSFFLLMIFGGSIYLIFDQFDYLDTPKLITIWLYSCAGVILLPIGMILSRESLAFNSNAIKRVMWKQNRRIRFRGGGVIVQVIVVFLLFVAVIFLFQYRASIGGRFPIEYLFYNQLDVDLGLLRSDATNNFQGKIHYFELFTKNIPMLLLLISFFNRKNTIFWKVLFYASLFFCVASFSVDLQKSPLIKLFLALFFAFGIEMESNKLSKIFLWGASLTSLIVLMYMFVSGYQNRSFVVILDAIANRFFVGAIRPFYYYLLYLENYGLLLGRTFPNPGGIFGFSNMSITVEVSKLMNPGAHKLGIVGSAPTVFYADWMVNFGHVIALFIMVVWGFLLRTVDTVLISSIVKYRSTIYLALYVYFIDYFSKYVETSFIQMIFDFKLYVPILIVIFLRNNLFLFGDKKSILRVNYS